MENGTVRESRKYVFRIIERFPEVNLVHHVTEDGTVWGSRCRRILKKGEEGWREVARFPRVSPKDFFEITRITARASRVDKCNLYPTNSGKILGIRGGRVYSISGTGTVDEIFNIRGDSVLHRGICEDAEGWCYFGEYFQNATRGPVRIHRVSPDMSEHEVAFEFHSGSIRHVHGIYSDPVEKGVLWVTTGDRDGECFLFRTADRFRTLDRVGDGTQTWRAVGLLFTQDSVCWLTDSHTHENHACRMNRRTGELDVGETIDCSVWYSASTREGVFVAFTTVEKGPAIQRNECSVLVSENAFEWEEVAVFRKDFWRPMSVFKYGILICPSGVLSCRNFYMSGEGVVGLDGRSVVAAIENTDRKQ